MLQERTNVQTLCTTISNQLAVPRSGLKVFWDHAFSIAAPRLWDALPDLSFIVNLLMIIKKSLKAHLFKSAFNYVNLFSHGCVM